MIKRIYIDNYKTLVNFELKLDRMNLLMGPNGSGKSSVFEVLGKLKSWMNGDGRLKSIFAHKECTCWMDQQTQRFEISFDAWEGTYEYVLVITHVLGNPEACRVKEEKVTFNGLPLLVREKGQVHVFLDDNTPGPEYPFDWTLSVLATLHNYQLNSKLARFREYFEGLVLGSILPPLMDKESGRESDTLTPRMENFVSWTRKKFQENTAGMIDVFEALKDVLPGFVSINFKDAGQDVKVMQIKFERPESGSKDLMLNFSELSEGQRVLVVLYTLLLCGNDPNQVLFLDEPDNFVSLREIQPWLGELEEFLGNRFGQVVLISHHPQVINFMGNVRSKWFYRETDGPTRIKEEPIMDDTSLQLSELVSRDWI